MSTTCKQIETAYESEIGEIVGTLFRTMVGTEVSLAAPTSPDADTVTALIAFGGKWSGGFELICGRTSALTFAQRFLQSDELSEFNDDVRDALGELANVIAGNLKQALPPGTNMGAPTIVEGKDYVIRVQGQHVLGTTTFTSDAGSFAVRLIEDMKLNEGHA